MRADTTTSIRHQDQCPRCDAGRLHAWDKLSDEEREVVRRLPASADFFIKERADQHRWCTRCWYEETAGAELDA